jgi:hypothetical protein
MTVRNESMADSKRPTMLRSETKAFAPVRLG